MPITQVDVADAAALSIVHVNRTIQTLRSLNVLCKTSHAIEVIDRKQLAKIAGFDGRYLNMPQLVSGWVVQIEDPRSKSTPKQGVPFRATGNTVLATIPFDGYVRILVRRKR